jgi:ketosteroid isomerase-like protein
MAYFDAQAEYECRRLMHDYVEAVDAHGYERLRHILTADAVVFRPSDPARPVSGMEAIILMLQARPRDQLGYHLVTNVSIEFDSPGEAHGSCRLLLYLADAASPDVPGKGRPVAAVRVGGYRDRFVRTAQGWRIRERRGSMFGHS